MPSKWETAPIVEPAQKWASAPIVETAEKKAPATWTEKAGAFLEGAVTDTARGVRDTILSPAQLVKDLADPNISLKEKIERVGRFGSDPTGMAHGLVESHARQGGRVVEDVKKKRYADAGADAVMTLVPGVGPALGDTAEGINQANREGNDAAAYRHAGRGAAAVAMTLAPEFLTPEARAAIAKGGAKMGAAIRGAGKGAAESAIPILKDWELNRPQRTAIEAGERMFKRAKEELAKNKTDTLVREYSAKNPTRPVEPLPPPLIPDASPIMPWSHENMASQYGVLPSGKRVGGPLTAKEAAQRASRPPAERPSPAWRNLPQVEAEASTPSVVAPPELPSGRRPLTAAEREAKYSKVSKAPVVEPGTPMDRLSPEQQQTAQQLADEIGPTGATVESNPVRYEDGARAKKVWNMADLLAEYKIPSEDAALMDADAWAKLTEAINQQNLKDWASAGGKGKKPNRHAIPGSESQAQIIKELEELEARKATEQ